MARMDIGVTGPGANPNKIMFYLGILFVVLGALIGGGWLIAALGAHEFEVAIFGLIFLVTFCGVGGFFAKIGHNLMHAGDEVLAGGAFFLGKIYDYEPDYQVLMNGQPCITLVVRFLINGNIREARVNTGDVNAARYPRGATVGIKLLGEQAALVPNSLSDTHLEREDDLMNPDLDPSGMQSSVGVSCPNCGANITVPLGMSRFCPYCDSKVSIDANGRINHP